MARGRFISEAVGKDKRLNSVSVEAELIFLLAIPHLDRDGLIIGEPMMLWGEVCPRRTEFIPVMDALIGELVETGLVIAYDTDEGRVLFFPGFKNNQQGMIYKREGKSVYPCPPGYERLPDGLRQISSDSAAEVTTNSRPTHDEVTTDSCLSLSLSVSVSEGEGEAPPSPIPQGETQDTHTRTRSAKLMTASYPGIEPKQLTLLTNEVKRIYGFDALIESPGDDRTEDKMRGEAYRLWKVGFATQEAMSELGDRWRAFAANFKNKRPFKDQLYELAVEYASGHSSPNGVSPHEDFSLEDLV
jgi:hypothetical protein